jgi:hypothetical protein
MEKKAKKKPIKKAAKKEIKIKVNASFDQLMKLAATNKIK